MSALSAAEILGLGGLRGDWLRLPDECLLVLTLPHAPDPRARQLLDNAMRRLAERLDFDPSRVLVLERGMTLDALSDDDLAALGLQRIAHGPW